jgi:uncharacterized membrane protein YfcA
LTAALSIVLSLTFLVEAAVVTAAGLIRGFSGFGGALILSPGLALVGTPREAVTMTVLLNSTTIFQLLWPALHQARWRDVGPMAGSAALTIPFGAMILLVVDAATLRRGIGAVVLGFSLVLLAGWRYRGRRTQPANLLVGAIGGILSGAAGFGGPPLILYFLAGDRPMAENRAGFIVFFALIQIVVVPTFLWAGLITWELVWRTVLVVPVYLIATHVGARLFRHADDRLARRVALGFLVLIGAATVLR